MKNYSFIIPHHNTPDLLQRLIDTIPQREDIEIIVVDDNSDEGKKANISRSDVKIIYIDKEHTKGAGKARNVGMDKASGKWLLFADADDIYKPNFIDILDKYKEEDIEILFFNIDSVNSKTLLPDKQHNRAVRLQNAIKNFTNDKKTSDVLLYECSWGPWRKMLLAEFVKQYKFYYEETPIGNDHFFSFQTSFFVKKWKVERQIVYSLTYDDSSLSYRRKDKATCIALLKTRRRIFKFYRFINHSDWNWKSPYKGLLPTSCIHCIASQFKRNIWDGIKLLYYFVTNFLSIEKSSDYYVKIIKEKIKERKLLNN